MSQILGMLLLVLFVSAWRAAGRERRDRKAFAAQVKLNLERARRFTAARDAKEFAILNAARNARRHAA